MKWRVRHNYQFISSPPDQIRLLNEAEANAQTAAAADAPATFIVSAHTRHKRGRKTLPETAAAHPNRTQAS